MKSSTRRKGYMKAYDVQDVIATIISQCGGYSQDIEIHGITNKTLNELVDMLMRESYTLMCIRAELSEIFEGDNEDPKKY